VLTKTVTEPAGKLVALEFAAACDPRTDGWKISIKDNGADRGEMTVDRESMREGWTPVKSQVTINSGKSTVVEITMEPVKPPTGRQGPPALSITVPTLVSR
jgi:hypothetical protein